MIEITSFYWPPGLFLLLTGFALTLINGRLRQALMLLAPLVTLWWIWQIPDGANAGVNFLAYELSPVDGSPLRRLFGASLALMTLFSALFVLNQATRAELLGAFGCAAAAINACFAGDLVSLFVFWQLLLVFSTLLIWSGDCENSRAAGLRYALMHLMAGLALKIGIEGLKTQTGDISVTALPLDNLYSALLLAGVLTHAAAAPLSVWLADAYPRATPGSTVFLSLYGTKTAVLMLILLFPGAEVLVWLGLYMMLHGVVYGLLNTDIRRLLAYTQVAQLGMIIMAVGIGTALALDAAAAHALVHLLAQALLFMTAATIIHSTGHNDLQRLGALAGRMPVTAACAVIGALTLIGLPLTAGFLSLSGLDAATREHDIILVRILLLVGVAGLGWLVFRYLWQVFLAPVKEGAGGHVPATAPQNLAMVVLAAACILTALLPGVLPGPSARAFGTSDLLLWLAIPIVVGGLYWQFGRRQPTLFQGEPWDYDWFWRRLAFGLGQAGVQWLARLRDQIAWLLRRFTLRALRVGRRHGGRTGVLARAWAIGTSVFWVMTLLTAYLIAYYLIPT